MQPVVGGRGGGCYQSFSRVFRVGPPQLLSNYRNSFDAHELLVFENKKYVILPFFKPHAVEYRNADDSESIELFRFVTLELQRFAEESRCMLSEYADGQVGRFLADPFAFLCKFSVLRWFLQG